MARVEPIRREDVPDLEDIFSRAEQALGFVPNSFFAMGRSPGILRAFTRLAREVIGVPGKAPLPLKRMAGYMASRSAGCMYCSSHTAETASVVDGVPPEKLQRSGSTKPAICSTMPNGPSCGWPKGRGRRPTPSPTKTWKNCIGISMTIRLWNWWPQFVFLGG